MLKWEKVIEDQRVELEALEVERERLNLLLRISSVSMLHMLSVILG